MMPALQLRTLLLVVALLPPLAPLRCGLWRMAGTRTAQSWRQMGAVMLTPLPHVRQKPNLPLHTRRQRLRQTTLLRRIVGARERATVPAPTTTASPRLPCPTSTSTSSPPPTPSGSSTPWGSQRQTASRSPRASHRGGACTLASGPRRGWPALAFLATLPHMLTCRPVPTPLAGRLVPAQLPTPLLEAPPPLRLPALHHRPSPRSHAWRRLQQQLLSTPSRALRRHHQALPQALQAVQAAAARAPRGVEPQVPRRARPVARQTLAAMATAAAVAAVGMKSR
jgi:hypothetical protein